MKTIELTDAELAALSQLLRLDLGAIGFEQKDQARLRSVLKKVRAAS